MTTAHDQEFVDTDDAVMAILDAVPSLHEDAAEAWAYVLTKVLTYLQQGPAAYRAADARHMPPADWSESDLASVQSAMEQFGGGRGLTPETPLEGLSVRGLSNAMAVLHFKGDNQRVTRLPGGGFLDEIQFKHLHSRGRAVVVYSRTPARGQ